MANNNYANGVALERAWVRDQRARGYASARTPGSKGPFDAFAARDGDLILMQAKYGGTSTFDSFGPADRQALRDAARRAGGRAVLVRKQRGQRGYTVIPQEDWPNDASTP